jgi:hypothetical protein
MRREGKFSRMRDGMLYNDPDEYYAGPPEGFITADIEVLRAHSAVLNAFIPYGLRCCHMRKRAR